MADSALDLAFLGSGAWQHVFVGSGDGGTEWVFKVPAAFGYTIPLRPRLRALTPSRPHKRALHWLLLAPDRLAARFDAAGTAPTADTRGWIRRALVPLATRSRAALEDGVAVYLRRDRRRRFVEMLEVLEQLSADGLADVLLPFRVIRGGAATLRMGDRVVSYQGPILVQRRAAFFGGGGLHVDRFVWQDLIDAQQRLWRRGVAFAEQNQILGPMNWALLDGRLRIADTSSFTRDARLARGLLDDASLDAKEGAVLARLDGSIPAESLRQYFRFVRSGINRERFDALWRADLKRGDRR
jgi:hypothetical protein